jgi:DMSO/TMAO reductase YedYZ molybdopterin-dependent catalytic subunit
MSTKPATQKASLQAERITLTEHPLNVEASYKAFERLITANNDFFIRDHFAQPDIPPADWRLHVEGAAGRSAPFSLEDLKSMPSSTETAVVECAGNGRTFLNQCEGLQWSLGAVGCAEWTGVSLHRVLEQADLLPEAVELIFEGADHGMPEKSTRPKHEIHFSRSLPISVAMRPEVLLAYQMNGVDLPAEHGGPVRLIVPGWYGTTYVKWLERIIASTHRFRGYFQTVEYVYWKTDDENSPERVPVSDLRVKSQIARPLPHEQVRRGASYKVFGTAWTSEGKITSVELSSDGGNTWHLAELRGDPANHGWQPWAWTWTPQATGLHTLMSRATDSNGRTQPLEHDEDYENYAINHTLPIVVKVI